MTPLPSFLFAMINLDEEFRPSTMTVLLLIVLIFGTLYSYIVHQRSLLQLAQSAQLSAQFSPNQLQYCGENSIVQLNQYNFKSWHYCLRDEIVSEGCLAALEQPLEEYDHRNMRAMTKILNSVPDHMHGHFGKSYIAYEAVNKLREKYGNLDVWKLRKLQEDIKETKLTKFDKESMDEHIKLIERKFVVLVNNNAEESELVGLFLDTLPDNEEWKPFKRQFTIGKHLIEDVYADLVKYSKEIDKSCKDKALFTRSTYRSKPPLPRKAQEAKFNGSNAQYVSSSFNSWVIDSGAGKNYARSVQNLVAVREVRNSSVALADGSVCEVYQAGDKFLHTGNSTLKLSDVHVSPAFEENLISVSQLTSSGFRVLFEENAAFVFKGKEVYLRAQRVNNLYRYFENKDSVYCVKKIDYHSCFGHPGPQKMRVLQKKYPDVKLSAPENCIVCKTANMRQSSYLPSEIRTTKPLELIHADLCGQMKYIGYDHSRNFVVFTDDYSRYMETYFLKGKSSNEVVEAFKEYKARMEKRFEERIREVIEIRTDNGGEFGGEFETFLKSEGINHQTSTPYCHQQNGVAERSIQKLEHTTKVLMYESCLPDRYWPEAVRTATYLENRKPHSRLGDKTPLEVMFPLTSNVNVKNMHMFGSTAISLIHPENRKRQVRGKFEPNAEHLVFVGYEMNGNGYRLLDPKTSRIVQQRKEHAHVLDGDFYFCKNRPSDEKECECKAVREDIFPSFEVRDIHVSIGISGGGETVGNPVENEDQPTEPEHTPTTESEENDSAVTESIATTEPERTAPTVPKSIATTEPERTAPTVPKSIATTEPERTAPTVPKPNVTTETYTRDHIFLKTRFSYILWRFGTFQ